MPHEGILEMEHPCLPETSYFPKYIQASALVYCCSPKPFFVRLFVGEISIFRGENMSDTDKSAFVVAHKGVKCMRLNQHRRAQFSGAESEAKLVQI